MVDPLRRSSFCTLNKRYNFVSFDIGNILVASSCGRAVRKRLIASKHNDNKWKNCKHNPQGNASFSNKRETRPHANNPGIPTCNTRKLVSAVLMRDFKRLQQDPPAGISGAPHDNNIMLWNAVIFGPDDTPWDGGNL
ncbi:uncharacterized protein LOC121978063 [Zingiber officinale]|uniref:uncharacterized protein LOC121978063 n=1 Tax=Zingiber officinale TaxID=94328 RepID=UPI001C4B192E|nr:uncharacterized protein LOC121978063 [Zingiber officinale]